MARLRDVPRHGTLDMLHGAMTALVTPFRDGGVDFDRLRENVAFQIQQGIDGLVPVGTTGESPTLSHDEHRRVIETVIDAAAGKVPVIAGTGSNSTAEAIELTAHAKAAGADACLVVNPYYNKPTQEGLYGHFSRIADVGLPVVLYNIPGRTGVTLAVSTMARLANHERIIAVKEATADLDMASQIAAQTDLLVLSGDDSLTLPIMSVGGVGVISVLSNLLPDQVTSLARHALDGDFAGALAIHQKLFPLFKAMFIETNPIPLKTALAMVGRDTGELRSPLCEMTAEHREALRAAIQAFGLL